MKKKEMQDLVIETIKDLPIVRTVKIKPEHSLVQDLGFDSLDEIELVMGIEEGFKIQVTDKEAESVKTVQDIFDLLCRYVEIEG